MKTKNIVVRVSDIDKKIIVKAAAKYHKETGAKRSVSATIRHAIEQYANDKTK